MNSPISRKQRIVKYLEENDSSQNIDAIAKGTGIPVDKIRQTLTTFEKDVVRVGHKQFDLLTRVHKGKVFRYTPTGEEYSTGTLHAEEDLHYFLTAFRDYWPDITFLDPNGRNYLLHQVKSNKHVPFAHYSGIEQLFSRLDMQIGDDLLITCQSIETYIFLVRKERAKDRDTLQIAVRNQRLADMVADILLHAISHDEADMFLIRKYLFIYPYFTDPPPDSLRRAIASDPRFIMTPRDRMTSWTGYPMTGDRWVIGLKKYYLHSLDGTYIPVVIEADEEYGGKVAYCTHCNERLIWDQQTGWRHTKDDLEWTDAYVPKEFFTYSDKRKTTH
ncbi:MAG: hypothetical protein AAB492_04555 [Patescibacteria group bacterium]